MRQDKLAIQLARIPQAKMHNFSVEFRWQQPLPTGVSQTLSVGSLHWKLDHLQEVLEK